MASSNVAMPALQTGPSTSNFNNGIATDDVDSVSTLSSQSENVELPLNESFATGNT